MITAAQLIGRIAIDGAESAEAKLLGVGSAADHVGLSLSRNLVGSTVVAGVALLGIGALSIKMSGDFQQSTNTLITSAGLSRTSIDAVRRGILQMSIDTATSTDQLVKGMFNVQSSLHLGASGLQVLKAAAEGARAENSDLAQTTDVLTTAMVNYHIAASQAVPVMNSLIVTVAAGKMHMNDLTGSLRNVLPVAAAFHIQLADVEGALATMANAGDRGTSAGTHLAMMFKMLASPVGTAKKEMAAMGLDSIKLAETMRTSLPAALKMIQDAVARHFTPGSVEYNRAILAILGGSKSGVAGLEIFNQGLKALGQNVNDASSALRKSGKDVENWSVIQGNFNFKLDAAKNAVEVLGISIGTKLLPIAGQFMDWVVAVAVPNLITFSDWFTNTAIPAMQQFAATVQTDVTSAFTATVTTVQNVITTVQNVINWFSQWQQNIEGAAAVITIFFIPALIKAGVEAVIAGGKIAGSFIASVFETGVEAVVSAAKVTYSFVASLIAAGIEGWVAAGKLAVYIGAMLATGTQATIAGAAIARQYVASLITSGYEAVVAGGKLVISYVAGLIVSAREAEISAATIRATIIPALTATGAAATVAAGVIGIAALAVGAAYLGIQEHALMMDKSVTNSSGEMTRNSQVSFYNMKSGAVMQMQDMQNTVTRQAATTRANVTASMSQLADQSLNKLRLLDNTGGGIIQHFGAAAMRVFDTMKSTGISDLSQLDASALSYLREIQGYVDAMNGQLSLGAANAATARMTAGQIHQHATGTSFAPGGLSLVAEDGAELVMGPRFGFLPRGSQVIPNNRLSQMGSGTSASSGPVYLNINIAGQRVVQVLLPEIVSAIRTSTGARF